MNVNCCVEHQRKIPVDLKYLSSRQAVQLTERGRCAVVIHAVIDDGESVRNGVFNIMTGEAVWCTVIGHIPGSTKYSALKLDLIRTGVTRNQTKQKGQHDGWPDMTEQTLFNHQNHLGKCSRVRRQGPEASLYTPCSSWVARTCSIRNPRGLDAL